MNSVHSEEAGDLWLLGPRNGAPSLRRRSGAGIQVHREWYKENPALTWTELKSALVWQYANERTVIEAVRKLFWLQQQEGETNEELEERIAGLEALAFPELAIQALLADVYVDALSDRDLRGDVLKWGPVNLAADIEAARTSKRLWDRIRGGFR